MLRLLIVFGLCAGLFADQAEARTIRYEFDVVQSNISFIDFLKLKLTFVDGRPYDEVQVAWETGEYEYYLRKLHPFGSVYGLAGKVVMDLHVSSSGVTGVDKPWKSGSISCVSGFLCLLDPTHFWESFRDGVLSYDSGFSTSAGTLDFYYLDSTGDGMLGWGPIIFDSGRYSCDYNPNCTVEYWAPSARFSIANFSRTEIAPVPLPASASLLAMGLMAFGFMARRRSRAA